MQLGTIFSTMSDKELELRRHEIERTKTVRQTIALGYRLQVICLACQRRVAVDLRRLEARGLGDRRLMDIGFSCTPCKATGRKLSIHPAGKDVYLRVLFQGEAA